MKKSYTEWSRYNVDEELTKLEEVDEREERAEGRKKAFKVKSQLEKEVATTTEVSAEILAAQAAVAALKAKKGSKKRQEQEVSVLQNKADLLSLKSETIKHVLDARNTCQMHLKNQQYDTALPLYQDALKQLDKLTNVLPQLEELDLVDKTDHEHHHDHHHEESSCGHSHEEKAKKMDYVAALPDKEDLKGVLRMFRNDIYNGIGHAEFGRKKYALASEAHKNVLLDDPTNTIAWLGRGRAFARMGVPLLSFLHFNQVILYDAEHDEVQDEIDIAKAAIHDMFYQEQETLLNQQVERLKQDSIQDTLRAINDLRAEADILMVEGLFRSAARKNEAILSVLDETKLSKYNSSAAFQQTKYGCHLNIAGCWIEMEKNLAQAIHHCSMALRIQPDSIVAYFRLAKAKHLDRQYAGAQEDFNRALQLCSDPTQKAEIDRALDKCMYDRGQCDVEYLRSQMD